MRRNVTKNTGMSISMMCLHTTFQTQVRIRNVLCRRYNTSISVHEIIACVATSDCDFYAYNSCIPQWYYTSVCSATESLHIMPVVNKKFNKISRTFIRASSCGRTNFWLSNRPIKSLEHFATLKYIMSRK